MTELNGILLNYTTAYHPETDGLSEAFVKRLKEVPRLVSSEKDWARDIARIQASINHSWHSSLGRARLAKFLTVFFVRRVPTSLSSLP